MPNKYDKYIILAACFMIQAIGVGTLVTYGVFFNSFVTEFGWSRAAISGASSLALFLSGLSAVIIGRLNDLHGPKNLMRGAAVLLAAGVVLTSQVSSLWQLYFFYGIIFGIGLGSVDVIALTTTARWFKRSRGMMTAVVKVGTGAGQFLIPLLASLLIIAYGWRQAYLTIGIFILVLLLAVAQVLKGSHSSSPSIAVKPEQDSTVVGVKCLNTKEAFKTSQFWIICSSYCLVVFCLLVILVHIVPHATDLGFSNTLSAGVLSTIGAMSILGRLAAGFSLDRLGSKPIMMACFCVLVSGLVWLQVADELWMLYVFATVYGISHGGFFTVISPLIAEVFGIASHGSIFGIVVFFGTTGGAIGPVIAGQLFDLTGNYTITFRIITVISLIGLSLLLFLKPIKNASHESETSVRSQSIWHF